MDIWVPQEVLQKAFGADFESQHGITSRANAGKEVKYLIPLSDAIALRQMLILGDLRNILASPLVSVPSTSYDDAPGGRGN